MSRILMPYYVPREWSPAAAEKIQLNFERLFQAVAEAAPTTVVTETTVVEEVTPPPINAESTTWELYCAGIGVASVGLLVAATQGINTVRASPPFADGPYSDSPTVALNGTGFFSGAPTSTVVAQDLIWDFDVSFVMRTDAAAATSDRRYLIGMCQNNLNTDTPAEAGCWFRYAKHPAPSAINDGGWVALCHDGTTLSSPSAVIAPIANSTRYLLRIRKVANQAFFSINGGPETVVNSNVPVTTRVGVCGKLRITQLDATNTNLYFSRAWCVYGS
jgi:hypothetical protein